MHRDNIIQESLKKSLDYILKRQCITGEWEDFEYLPFPGKSNSWVTSYIIRHLYNYSIMACDSTLIPNLEIACNRLRKLMLPDNGWGYNEHTRTDSDSTANAILALNNLDFSINQETIENLLSFRNDDGGFSTFKSRYENDSWGASHLDVIPIIIEALDTVGVLPYFIKNKSIDFIKNNYSILGFWNSFWWETPLYSTRECIRILLKNNIKFDFSNTLKNIPFYINSHNPFNLALLLDILCMLKADIEMIDLIISILIELQNVDGSWRSHPFLRQTSDKIMNPWIHKNSGEVIFDKNNLFTTVTVVCSITTSTYSS